jgi:hypothetical protein
MSHGELAVWFASYHATPQVAAAIEAIIKDGKLAIARVSARDRRHLQSQKVEALIGEEVQRLAAEFLTRGPDVIAALGLIPDAVIVESITHHTYGIEPGCVDQEIADIIAKSKSAEEFHTQCDALADWARLTGRSKADRFSRELLLAVVRGVG